MGFANWDMWRVIAYGIFRPKHECSVYSALLTSSNIGLCSSCGCVVIHLKEPNQDCPHFFFFFVKPRDSKANLHTHEKSSHKHIRTAHSSNLNLASGNLGTLRFLTFIRTRKRATKWTKTKTKRGNQNKCFYQGPSLKGLTHTHTHTYSSCTWPPCDLPNFSAFKNAVKKAILPLEFIRVCVCVRIPLRLSPPSLDKNYIIAVCDLIFLKEHFEVSSFALFVSFPTFFF